MKDATKKYQIEQPNTEVYRDDNGEIVITQEGPTISDPQIVTIDPAFLPLFITWLQSFLDTAGQG
jgi:hypothetical protein